MNITCFVHARHIMQFMKGMKTRMTYWDLFNTRWDLSLKYEYPFLGWRYTSRNFMYLLPWGNSDHSMDAKKYLLINWGTIVGNFYVMDTFGDPIGFLEVFAYCQTLRKRMLDSPYSLFTRLFNQGGILEGKKEKKRVSISAGIFFFPILK